MSFPGALTNCDSVHDNETSDSTESEFEISKKDPDTCPAMNRMLNLCKEFVIMVLVALTYASVTNNPPKIGKSPACYPFFNQNNYVTDWYRGEISKAINQARSNDMSFVMFYAPWDAESQFIRKEFEMAANVMHEEVTFAAINCWQPESECKTQYSKVYRWPVLIAYPTYGRGIQYNGPFLATYIINFLNNVINPFIRIEEEDVREFLTQYEVVLEAKLDASPGSVDYSVLYSIALSLLERDPQKSVAVILKTQARYSYNGSKNEPKLYLHMWNETLIYNTSDETPWSFENLFNWIVKHIHQCTTWLSPTGVKSLTLNNYVNGPVLILFTPRNPLLHNNDYYLLLKELGLEYNDCNDSPILKLLQNLTRKQRINNYFNHQKLNDECQIKRNFTLNTNNMWSDSSDCRSFNNTYSNEHLKAYTCSLLLGRLNMNLSFLKTQEKHGDNAINFDNSHQSLNVNFVSKDTNSPESLKLYTKKRSCKLHTLSENCQPVVFALEMLEIEKNTIRGMACMLNKSLSMVALDSFQYYHFAEKLGIDLKNRKDKSAVVILDNQMESHFVLNNKISLTNLRSFIANYSKNSLIRALESFTGIQSKNNHEYTHQNEDEAHTFWINELNYNTFLPSIMKNNKATVIFYYSKQCSFCNGISYKFLQVAKYLSEIDNLMFTRIEGDLNSLPWEYTMEKYPTILFIPANRKSESRVFPSTLTLNVPNILSFVLTNLEPFLKLNSMWIICDRNIYKEKDLCISQVRNQTLVIIEKTLQLWRIASWNNKQKLFRKLQDLRHLHILLLENEKNNKIIKNYFQLLGNSFETKVQ